MAQTTKTGIGDFAAIAVPSTGPLYASDTSAAALAVAIVDASGGQIGTASNPLITSGGGGASSNQVQGTAASGATAVGNPLQMGGVVNTATPSALTTGQAVPQWMGARGSAANFITSQDGASIVSVASSGADAVTNVATSFLVTSRLSGFNATSWDRLNTVQGATAGTGIGVLATADVPVSSANAGIVPVQTGSLGSAATIKSGAGNLYSINCVSTSASGYLMLFDATSPPADGAVTPKRVFLMAANSSIEYSWDIPIAFVTGMTAVFSSTGPFTKTASATAFISGSAK